MASEVLEATVETATQTPPAPYVPTGLPARMEEEWSDAWKGPFLRGLRAMDNVTAAAKLAGVHRDTVYEHRKTDEAFRLAWEDAVEQATDNLEVFAHRMGTTGLEFTVTRRTVKRQLLPDAAGVLRMTVVEETEVEETGRTISPAVTMFLLRAYRPGKYAPAQRVEHGGPDGGPLRIESLHAIDVRIAALRAELAPPQLEPPKHPDIEGKASVPSA